MYVYIYDTYSPLLNVYKSEYNFFKPERLSGFRPDIRQNLFLKKKSGRQDFAWLLKQFGATVTS